MHGLLKNKTKNKFDGPSIRWSKIKNKKQKEDEN